VNDNARLIYWRSVRRLTGFLLSLWLLANIVAPWFARDLDGLRASGFPSAFWITAQGSLLLYLALIVVYILAMVRIERRYFDAIAQDRDAPEPEPEV
jgi:putative solute:sodium symporter small subunit